MLHIQDVQAIPVSRDGFVGTASKLERGIGSAERRNLATNPLALLVDYNVEFLNNRVEREQG